MGVDQIEVVGVFRDEQIPDTFGFGALGEADVVIPAEHAQFGPGSGWPFQRAKIGHDQVAR